MSIKQLERTEKQMHTLFCILEAVSPYVELTLQLKAGLWRSEILLLLVPRTGITGVHHYVQINARLVYVSKDRPDLALGLQLSVSDLIPQGFGVSGVNTELLWCEI